MFLIFEILSVLFSSAINKQYPFKLFVIFSMIFFLFSNNEPNNETLLFFKLFNLEFLSYFSLTRFLLKKDSFLIYKPLFHKKF